MPSTFITEKFLIKNAKKPLNLNLVVFLSEDDGFELLKPKSIYLLYYD